MAFLLLAITTNYNLHSKNIVHMTQGSNELHFFYDAQNKPAVVVLNGTPYSYVKNLQGDIVAILDGNGTAVVQYQYDAWGRQISRDVVAGNSNAAALSTLNPFRYRGYVYDEETGLYYLRNRYYASTQCRFVSPDSYLLGNKGRFGNNCYLYCNSIPTVFADPNGTDFEYVGFGVQIEGTFGVYGANAGGGIEAIVYRHTTEAEDYGYVVAIYVYGECGVAPASDATIETMQALADTLLGSADELVLMGAGAGDSTLKTAVQAKLPQQLASASISVFAVYANEDEGFNGAHDYTGIFKSVSGNVWHVKGSHAWSPSCKTIGLGATTSTGFGIGYSKSDYYLLFTTGDKCEQCKPWHPHK